MDTVKPTVNLQFERVARQLETGEPLAAVDTEYLAQCEADWARLDPLLKQAVELPLPATEIDVTEPPTRRRGRMAVFAIAASLAAVIGIVMTLPLTSPIDQELTADIVEHLNHEEPGEAVFDARIDPDSVRASLAAHGLAFEGELPPISYLHDCVVGGENGTHIAMMVEGQPVTLLIFPKRGKGRAFATESGGYQLAVTSRHGSTLVFSSGDAAVARSSRARWSERLVSTGLSIS